MNKLITKPFEGLEKTNSDYGVTYTKYRCRKCNNIFFYSCDGFKEHYKKTGHFPTLGINRITHVKKLFVYKFPFNIIHRPFFKWINVEQEEIQKEKNIKKQIASYFKEVVTS